MGICFVTAESSRASDFPKCRKSTKKSCPRPRRNALRQSVKRPMGFTACTASEFKNPEVASFSGVAVNQIALPCKVLRFSFVRDGCADPKRSPLGWSERPLSCVLDPVPRLDQWIQLQQQLDFGGATGFDSRIPVPCCSTATSRLSKSA
jgi:hypothetical protein